jgi:hypothetical protein
MYASVSEWRLPNDSGSVVKALLYIHLRGIVKIRHELNVMYSFPNEWRLPNDSGSVVKGVL